MMLKTYVFLSLLSVFSVRADVYTKEEIFKLPDANQRSVATKTKDSKPKGVKKRKPRRPRIQIRKQGNLPGYAVRSSTSNGSSSSQILLAKTKSPGKDLHLKIGDILQARINQDILGYEGSLSPVRAMITKGRHKGAYFVGNATLDPKTKHILVRFTHFRSKDDKTEATLEATVHSPTGRLGVIGRYNSNYWNFFWAEVLSRAVSGYASTSRQESKTAWGQNQIENTPDNAGKTALSQSAQASAERFKEESMKAPSYTVVSGPSEVQIFIIKPPKGVTL